MNHLRNLSMNDVKKARDMGKSKFTETRDRFQSQPSKNFDTSAKAPPPPPPARSSGLAGSSSTVSRNTYTPPSPPQHPSPGPPALPRRQSSNGSPNPAAPPPIARRPLRQDDPSPDASQSSLPSSLSRNNTSTPNQPKIDWSNLSQEDKLAFFALLDEYFESRRGGSSLTAPETPVRAHSPAINHTQEPAPAQSAPPPIRACSRPKLPTSPSLASASDDFTLSYPPATQHGSGALDLAYYFSPQTHWETAWYKSTNNILPPPLEGMSIPGHTYAWESHGTKKTVFGGVIFADLSICWYSVSFNTMGNADPNDAYAVQRSEEYILPPEPMQGPALVEAHETYGETVAGFAESYEGTGQYCGRGECWDLASEALKYFDQFDYVAKPVPSTSCTHGHLIFSGKATSRTRQVGKWRGGDDRVRRGDIVQWRSARVVFDHGGYATLGDPDHTAIVVTECVPSESVADGKSLRPAAVGLLEVIEQSIGSPPKRETYDLNGMSEGEIWIYRPVGMVDYVGTVLEAKRPDGVNALRI